MRKVDSKNQLWHREENGAIQIGFTKSFLDGLEQCWNILPAHNELFKVKSPLLTIETNEQMYSLMSPVAGFFVTCSTKAQNFPDKLTEEDVVIELATTQPDRALTERDRILQEIQRRQQRALDGLRAAEAPRLRGREQQRVVVNNGAAGDFFQWAAEPQAPRVVIQDEPDHWEDE